LQEVLNQTAKALKDKNKKSDSEKVSTAASSKQAGDLLVKAD